MLHGAMPRFIARSAASSKFGHEFRHNSGVQYVLVLHKIQCERDGESAKFFDRITNNFVWILLDVECVWWLGAVCA